MNKETISIKDIQHDLGTKVFVIRNVRETIKTKCRYCDNEGFIYLQNTGFICPSGCNSGYTLLYRDKWVVEVSNATITAIRLSSVEDSRHFHRKNIIEYWFNGNDFADQQHVFRTLQEAEEMCIMLNDKYQKGYQTNA